MKLRDTIKSNRGKSKKEKKKEKKKNKKKKAEKNIPSKWTK